MRVVLILTVFVGCTFAAVSELSSQHFESFIRDHPLAFVEFTTHEGYSPVLSELANNVELSSQIVFGHCRVAAGDELSLRHGLRQPSSTKLFKNGKSYHVSGMKDDIEHFVLSHLRESPTVLSSDHELNAFTQAHDVAVIAFVEGKERELYSRIADEQRQHFAFALATFASKEHRPPSLVIVHSEKNQKIATDVYDGVWYEGPIHKWLQTTAVPYFASIKSRKEFAEYVFLEQPVAYLISDATKTDHSEYLGKLRSVSSDLRKSVYLVHVDPVLFPKEAESLLRSVGEKTYNEHANTAHGLMVIRNVKTGHSSLYELQSTVSNDIIRSKLVQYAKQ